MIPYGQHFITDDDIAAVIEVLRSDRITQGGVVPAFESAVSNYCQSRHAVAVSSGTAALHLACLSLGLGEGDHFWTTTNTFVASANCARFCGATVDFIDIDPRTYNISIEALQIKLEHAQAEGCLPKIVMPVHFAGQPCNMREIAKLADQYGFHVIEDACHAMGARYDGNPVGSCEYSDVTVFSFHPVKMITTGEGGMLLTNSDKIHEKAMLLRTHGTRRESEDSWRYEQLSIGFNYRLTDIQAALGLSQLSRLDSIVERRRLLANRYMECLCNAPLTLPWQESQDNSSWHLFVVQLEDNAGISRDVLYRKMIDAGIGVNVHYIPVHTQPYYRSLGCKLGDFPQAERYYEHCLTLPLYPELEEASQDAIVSTLTSNLGV